MFSDCPSIREQSKAKWHCVISEPAPLRQHQHVHRMTVLDGEMKVLYHSIFGDMTGERRDAVPSASRGRHGLNEAKDRKTWGASEIDINPRESGIPE
ncbi:hypothetical protein MGYG_08199 [Nannizzia gypsea CBS 118893]|uniref:Uncharacterized protein n=1 Tax=Arthroderma gypseum (strain ATCC MYA-4604 / CBS 118893) TaxID=535722 RepID=E4V5B1_ARTGP|nr:hypothetical protein MGYG_08199 [Nannizzia gypsea CBS 118893]EFR05185.1 hypothetical protein MGYG_08199 [Nannizzia gypsea CBS 118893]